MRAYEWLAVAYFVGLAGAALSRRVAWRRRLAVAAGALAAAVLVAGVAWSRHELLRAWLPNLALVGGYWLPALLTDRIRGTTPFESWLAASDARLRPRLPAIPTPLGHLVEVAYLFCYPLVPAAFAVVWTLGTAGDVTRFWMAVLAAGYACYVSLPWLPSRPPRLAGAPAPMPPPIAALNVFVLGRVSHQLNTFPSGHVAVACAAAAMVAPVSALAGTLIAVGAAAIAVGAAAGRYHYIVDVLLGVLVGAAAIGAALLI